jgi:hypothetical protein
LNFAPAPSPAIVSVWPTWVIAPMSAKSSAPELSVITGMPASTALRTESRIASGFGAETASPSTLSVTAASIICACFCGSLLDSEYLSVTPICLAPSSAPFFATAQNEPPSPCVTMAIVTSWPWVRSTSSLVVGAPSEEVSSPSSSPQAAANAASPSTINSASSAIRSCLIR